MQLKHLSQKELARRWNISHRTLERWRWAGEGPQFMKLGGRVVYRMEDITAFAQVGPIKGVEGFNRASPVSGPTYGHDPDVAVREMSPVDEMTLVSKEEPFNTKLGWDRFRCDTVVSDLVEGCKQAGDVFLGLIISPPVTGVAVDVIEAVGRPFLDSNGGHRIRPCSAQSPRLPSAVDTSPRALRTRGSARPSAG